MLQPTNTELDLGTYWNPSCGSYVTATVHTGGKLSKGAVRWVIRLHTALTKGSPALNYTIQLKPDPVCDQLTVRKLVNRYLGLEGYKRIYPYGGNEDC